MDKNKCSSCGEKKCSCKNKDFTKAVIEIDNPEKITLMRRVVIPTAMGDDTVVPPAIGKYHNVLLYYEANQKSYLYSSDGIPTLLVNGVTDYEQAVNLPQINGVTLLGDKSSADLELADAPMVITVADGNTHWSGADTAEEVYDFFLNKGKVNIVFNGGENYSYEIASAAYIPGEEKMMCTLAVATIAAGETSEFEGNALFGTMTLYTANKAIDVSQIELQPKLYIADFTGLDLNYNELSGVPATNASIGMVKSGDGLEVTSDGTLSVSDIEQYAHFFDTVADMKSAINLVAGDYARTLGYHSSNDRGSALYKIRTITDQDVVDEGFIIAMNDANLVAELIIGENLAPEMVGAYGDGVHDDTDVIESIIVNNIDIYGAGTYLVDNLTIGFAQIPEDTPQKKSNVYLHEIVSTASNAVCLRGCINFTFDYIENTVGNGIAFIDNTYDSNIHGTRITAKKNGIYFNTDTDNGGYRCWVQYTEFNIRQIVAEENALHVYNTDRWFNSNRFIDCVFAGGSYGIYLDRTSTGAVDENTFTGISLEKSYNGIYLNRTNRTKIESVRTQEVTNTRLKMDGNNKYCDIYIGVAGLADIDLSGLTGGWGTVIRGVFLDDDNADAIFSEIAVNTTNLSAYYSQFTYKLVSQLENGVVWPDQEGNVFNYCNNHPSLLGNATVKSKFGAKNFYVDSRGNATINFNSSILQYLGVMHLYGDSQSNFTTPVKIQIDGVDAISLPKPCSFMFTKDYRKVIIL